MSRHTERLSSRGGLCRIIIERIIILIRECLGWRFWWGRRCARLIYRHPRVGGRLAWHRRRTCARSCCRRRWRRLGWRCFVMGCVVFQAPLSRMRLQSALVRRRGCDISVVVSFILGAFSFLSVVEGSRLHRFHYSLIRGRRAARATGWRGRWWSTQGRRWCITRRRRRRSTISLVELWGHRW